MFVIAIGSDSSSVLSAVAPAAAARDVLGKPKPREKMPAILVASKMKSGLPKPVHSAAPILHVPPARAGPQPCYLKLGSKVEVSKTTYPSQIPLKSQVLQGLQEPAGEGLPLRKSGSVENGFDTQQLSSANDIPLPLSLLFISNKCEKT
ncbi:hypothetical protein H8959_003092 [Pygathrix nigripes]